MRSLNKSWIGVALAILFGLSLFFFRGSSRYSNLFNSDNFVANVSGTQISTSHFLRSLEMNIGQFAQMIGEELSGDQIRAFQIHQLVLQNLINNAIFENEFDKLNFILDDSIIAEKTKNRFPNLYINNKINDDALKSFLSQQRLKIEDLVNIIDYETRAVVFDNLIFEKNYPNAISDKINLYNNQSRNISLLRVPFNKIVVPGFAEEKITKNDTDLINYYEENQMNYMSQERRDITYLVIDKDNFRNDFIPSNEEIVNYYSNNKELFTISEKRSFKQFNFKTKDEAENFRIKISSLSNDAIIKYASDNQIKFNNFEKVDKNQVLEELSNVIFSIKKGDISEVVSTTLANHIIVLDEINKKREQTIDEVNDTIKNTLTEVQLGNFINDLKSKINQQILNGFSITEIATENNLKIEKINNSIQNNKENNFVNSVVNTAFSLNKDFISDIFEYDKNKSFILNVNEIYPSKVDSIDIVFNDVTSDFIKSKKLNYALKIFEDNKINKNFKNISSIFSSNIEEVDITLSSENLPKSLISNIFETKLNEISFSSDEQDVYYARVNNIMIPNETINSEDISLLSELKNAFGNEIIKTKNISINDELINGLLSQYK